MDMTTGRLDTRFSGPTFDPLSKEAELRSASSRDQLCLRFCVQRLRAQGPEVRREPGVQAGNRTLEVVELSASAAWRPQPLPQATNVMPDLANAMKYNPNLKVLLNAGYFDLATPFYEGIYEMHHLPIPPELAKQYRIQVLRIRPHGVRARGCAERTARQRGGLHPRERAAQDQVSGAPRTVAHSIVCRTRPVFSGLLLWPPGPATRTRDHGSAVHPQFLHHRAHRPRQIHAGRPPARADRRAHPARDDRAGARFDGPRARARHHHQGQKHPPALPRRRTATNTSSI